MMKKKKQQLKERENKTGKNIDKWRKELRERRREEGKERWRKGEKEGRKEGE